MKKSENDEYDFLKVPLKFSQATTLENSSSLGSCHMTITGVIVNQKFTIFVVVLGYIGELLYLFMKSFLAATSYRVLAAGIENLILSAPASLKTILTLFWTFFELFRFGQAFNLGQHFFSKQ